MSKCWHRLTGFQKARQPVRIVLQINKDISSGDGVEVSGIGTKDIRTAPANFAEQLVLQDTQEGGGQPIMQGKINDNSYKNDWVKMSTTHRLPNKMGTIEVHYWKNIRTNETKGFKFKNNAFFKITH